MLNAVYEVVDLKTPPGNKLEKLKGAHSDRHSIRVNDQYRIFFKWSDHNAYNVQIVDYH